MAADVDDSIVNTSHLFSVLRYSDADRVAQRLSGTIVHPNLCALLLIPPVGGEPG